MHAPSPPRRRLAVFAGVTTVSLFTWNTHVVPALPAPAYPPANLAATAAVLAAARGTGLTWAELGLHPRRLGSGARWGGAAFALVAAGYAIALAVPATRPLLADARVADLDAAEVAYRVLVRYPIGTVLWEEVAFRGVLLAALARVLPLRWAVALSAVAFGLWHMRPAADVIAANGLVDSVPAPIGVLIACAAAAVAGVVLTWLRLRAGSLLAPALLHLATNSLGTLVAVTASAAGAGGPDDTPDHAAAS